MATSIKISQLPELLTPTSASFTVMIDDGITHKITAGTLKNTFTANLATTTSVNIVSASAWGAFQSASAYSASGFLADTTQSSQITALSQSVATTFSASNYTIATNSASFSGRIDGFATTGSNVFIGNQTVTGSIYTSGSNTLVGITTLTGSLFVSGTLVITGSLILSGSQTLKLTGSLRVLGTSSFQGEHTLSGSNTIIGNTTMSGSVNISGSTIQYGNNTLIGNNTITGSNTLSGSNTISGSNYILGNTIMSGSLNISGSQTRYGITRNVGTWDLTGSMNVSGSITQIGNNTLIGNTILSGSIEVSGSFTGSLNIKGDVNVISGSSFYRWGNKLFNYASYYHTGSQNLTQNIVYSGSLSSIDYENGFIRSGSNGNKNKIYALNTGIYNMQYSLQFETTNNSAAQIDVWFAKDGNDMPYTDSIFYIPTTGYGIGAVNVVTEIISGSYIELKYATADVNAAVNTVSGSGAYSRPQSPAIILTLTQIS